MAATLNELLDCIDRAREVVDAVGLATLWTAGHVALHHVVLGDPAVRPPGRHLDRRPA